LAAIGADKNFDTVAHTLGQFTPGGRLPPLAMDLEVEEPAPQDQQILGGAQDVAGPQPGPSTSRRPARRQARGEKNRRPLGGILRPAARTRRSTTPGAPEAGAPISKLP